jgi:spermidine synthase
MEYGIVLLFVVASFLASALLFSVQPMIGKMVLPVFGGTPAVWNTCLVFFQGTLLCGYLFAYGIGGTGTAGRRQVSLLYLLAFAALAAVSFMIQPIALTRSNDQPLSLNHDPALILLGVLSGSAALPLVMISTTAPLVQAWFALIGHRRSRDPYFLYAASNTGSLLALLIYPFLIEPNLGLTAQSRLWKIGFMILATLVLACGLAARWMNRSQRVASEAPVCQPPPAAKRLSPVTWAWWIALVFLPASWLMGVTTYLTTDLAPIPLMWIIPLSLYLLSFILAFSSFTVRLVRAANRSLPYLIAPLVLVMLAGFVHLVWIPLHLAAFFAGALACHSALARMRPPAQNLSVFYVTIALGGLLGGIWNALVAPVLFDRIVEYPLALILACLIVPASKAHWNRGTSKSLSRDLLFAAVVFGLTLILATNQAKLSDSVLGAIGVMIASGMGFLACVSAERRPIRFALVVAGVLITGGLTPGVNGRLLHIERDFFGVLRVTHDAQQNANRLFHGSTLHGQQSLDPAFRHEPLTYFTRSGPIGQLFPTMERRLNRPDTRVAIVGLGVGTLASYAEPGQRWTFYEIDGAVERIARNPRFFTYLQDCKTEDVEIILGDARQRLASAPDRAYQLIVLDAFSSDALPVHLLSREAIRLYRAKLVTGGLLLFNLTNRYLDLNPVIGRQASDAGWVCRINYDIAVSDDEIRAGKQKSIWAVMAAQETDLDRLAADPRWQVPRLRQGSNVWTDDYSDLAAYLLFIPKQYAGTALSKPD